jgi:predicted small secreted protein
MVKKSASFVLASFRGSTYGSMYASPLRSLRPHLGEVRLGAPGWAGEHSGLFDHPARISGKVVLPGSLQKEVPMRQPSSTLFAVTLLFAIGTLAVAGGAYADEKEKKGKAEMAAAAKVTINQAIKAASDKVAGTVIEAELEKKHNKLVWEVEVITAENKVMEVHIDAETGDVIDVKEEKAMPKKTRKHEQKREHKD